jgi:hypothetical protein
VNRGFSCGFGKERFDHFFDVGTFTLRTVYFFCVVFFDTQHFGEWMVAFAADVFVQRHICLSGRPVFTERSLFTQAAF